MVLSGPTIATTQLYAMSRDGPRSGIDLDQLGEPTTIVFHAPRFQYAVAPTKPVEGVVRDKDTGRPIAGLRLRAAVYEERQPGPRARASRLRPTPRAAIAFPACPRRPAYRLFVEPARGPALSRGNLPGTGRALPRSSPSLRYRTKAGRPGSGRVTDKATGKPVPGHIDVFTFSDNPHVNEFPGYVLDKLAALLHQG